MKVILIIEDDFEQRNFLSQIALQINNDIEVKSTPSAKEALEISNEYEIDAFFIDIQLIDDNGIELAKALRKFKKYKFTPMIFITAIPTKEMEAFHDIHAYDYLIKPFRKSVLQKVMKNILIDYVENTYEIEEKYLLLDFKGVKQKVKFTDICYVEYRNRKIVIRTQYEEIAYKHISIKKIKNELDETFIQVHRSFLVNKDYIRKINLNDREIEIYREEKMIPIGTSYKKYVGDLLNGII